MGSTTTTHHSTIRRAIRKRRPSPTLNTPPTQHIASLSLRKHTTRLSILGSCAMGSSYGQADNGFKSHRRSWRQ
jgi:hypothetical protein